MRESLRWRDSSINAFAALFALLLLAMGLRSVYAVVLA
jgi:hypothetical protein